jgi:chemotaxis protein histidine kinase CheA/CheY-like chemotaxis protein
MPEYDSSELLEYFLSEADDHINTLDKGISDLEVHPNSKALIEEMFRAAHTLKGAAALVKLNTTSNIAHRMEDILEGLKEKNIKHSKNISELLSYILDAIKGIVYDVTQRKPETPEVEHEVIQKINEVIAQEKIPIPSSETDQMPEALDLSEAMQEKRDATGRRKEDFEFFSGNFVKIDVRKVEDMLNMIGEITIKKNYLFQKTKHAKDVADEIFFSGRRLLDAINTFSEKYSYAMPSDAKYIDPLLSEFGELEFDKYDELNLFSRRLQEITNDITEALKDMTTFFDSFTNEVQTIENMVTFLKSDVSEMRMINIGRLFQRFSRSTKDLAKQSEKKIELVLIGSDTLIDKVIFERLFDPIMHIVRNAISHGIETPQERIRADKKEEGTILLSARREGTNVVIETHDDGKGIDEEKVFDEAMKKGLIKPDQKLTREETLGLIFAPGFSTADAIDMTSGRGMGMNIVRRRIAALNGIIELETEKGIGTTVRIKVPSSLAISNVVVVSSGNMEFVIPVSLIDEIIQLDITYKTAGINYTMNYRGTDISAKNLAELLGLAAENTDNSDKPVVICSVSNKKVGLIVDKIIAQEETIIKPINRFLAGLGIYAGTTISGDGRIRLALNPTRIFEEEAPPAVSIGLPLEERESKKILVVDDSLSVRKYVSAFLEAKRFKVHTATNGLEALNILAETPIDMIITDLEMPVMHGYELIEKIKHSDKLKHLPVIVLTSRSSVKHKQKALEAGVQDFLVKPFEEQAFLDILRKHLLLQI